VLLLSVESVGVESLEFDIPLSEDVSSLGRLLLLCESMRALRVVLLVLVRVSERDAPERSLVTEPMLELVPVEGSADDADESLCGADADVAPGLVVLLS
jgi:hypothetical protein